MASRSMIFAAWATALALLAETSLGFGSHPGSRSHRYPESASSLAANRDNIRAAMEATERFGIHSPEARLAWETVEEFDARTNDGAAYTPRTHEGLSPQDLEEAYRAVGQSMEAMRARFAAQTDVTPEILREVAAALSAHKLAPPDRKPAPRIPGLWDAKLKARALTQQHGATSPEAKLAWEEVEEIAASGLSNALRQDDDYPTAAAAEACLALEELGRVLGHAAADATDPNFPASYDPNAQQQEYPQNYDPNYGPSQAYGQPSPEYNAYQNYNDPPGYNTNDYYDGNDGGGGGGGGTYH